jgi:hypothetical protein
VVRRTAVILWTGIATATMAVSLVAPPILLGGERQRFIRRLDDPTRVKVLATLAGLVILGFAMVLLTWLAARIVERYRHGTSFFQPTPRPGEHEWAKKPLIPPEGDSSDPLTPDS